MLLCRDLDSDPIYVKVGRTVNPYARMPSLLLGCPMPARQFFVADVGSYRRSMVVERNLHRAMSRWHIKGEWFRVRPDDRAAFNASWRVVFERHSLEGGSRPRWMRIKLTPPRKDEIIKDT
jgi:T5orf172 domain